MSDRPDSGEGARAGPVGGGSTQIASPPDWPPPLPPLGQRPLPDLEPLDRIGVQPPAPPPPELTRRERRRQKRLERRRQRSWARWMFGWLMTLLIWFLVLSVLWVAAYRYVNPPFTLTMASDLAAGHSVNKRWMPLERIDPDMARAAIAGEDADFCTHSGFDYRAMAAAAWRNAKGGKVLRGGSTISQQTAKNVFLWQGGGYVRKALEAWFALLIEQIWGKRRIMEVYLNVAETGIGTYGANAGALRYFGHDASKLSVQEAARIAAVLPLPKKRPGVAPKGFTRRYGKRIAAGVAAVRRDGLDGCVR